MSQLKNNVSTESSWQTHRAAVWGFLALNILIVLFIWFDTSFGLLMTGYDGLLIAIGRLFGLLAALTALLQFTLMARANWIERAFGLENLVKFHRTNGYAVIILIVLHPIALTVGYASGSSLIQQYLTFLQQYESVILSFTASILFFVVAFSSVYIVRKRLRFESWYYVHLMVYAAIILAFGHQIAVGGSFATEDLYRYYWIGLYGFVAINFIIWRFGITGYQFIKYRFKVDHLTQETPDATSVYITGNNLNRWKSIPGQYVLVRFLKNGMWGQEHPFSLSYVPKNNNLRVTIKALGDYTRLIPSLKSNTKVMISGPFGAFTNQITDNNKRLYVAGGIGITPLRTLLEESVANGNDNVLIYGNRTTKDIVFSTELAQLGQEGRLQIHHIISAQPDYKGETGYVSTHLIAKLVPDYKARNIFICGPPAMTDQLRESLRNDGVNDSKIHFERFSFHSK